MKFSLAIAGASLAGSALAAKLPEIVTKVSQRTVALIPGPWGRFADEDDRVTNSSTPTLATSSSFVALPTNRSTPPMARPQATRTTLTPYLMTQTASAISPT